MLTGNWPDVRKDEKEHVRELERLNMELAGQVGFLQGQLALAQEGIKLLQAPPEEEEELEIEVRKWWQFWKAG
jgi:hypothetical protein